MRAEWRRGRYEFVLEFSANSKKWVPVDCKTDPEGCGRWMSLFESGTEGCD